MREAAEINGIIDAMADLIHDERDQATMPILDTGKNGAIVWLPTIYRLINQLANENET